MRTEGCSGRKFMGQILTAGIYYEDSRLSTIEKVAMLFSDVHIMDF